MKESKSNSPLEGMKIFHPTRTLTPYLRGSGKKLSRLRTEKNFLTKEKTEKNVFPLEKKKSD